MNRKASLIYLSFVIIIISIIGALLQPHTVSAALSATVTENDAVQLNWSGTGSSPYTLYRGDTIIYSGSSTNYTDSELQQVGIYGYHLVYQNYELIKEGYWVDESYMGIIVPGRTETRQIWVVIVPGHYEVRNGQQIWIPDVYGMNTVMEYIPPQYGWIYNRYWVDPAYGYVTRNTPLVQVSILLDVPQDISALATNDRITVSWSPVLEATAYQLEVDGNPVPVVNETQLSYVHTNLSSSTTHTYRVRSIKDDLVGAWSALLTVQTLPSTPGNLTAVATSMTITLNWNAVTGASSYELELDGQTITNLKDTTFKQNDLIPGSVHTYRVRAVNASGSSPWSAEGTIMTVILSEALLDVPQNISALATNDSITVSWSPVLEATAYQLEVDSNTVPIDNETQLSYVHTNLSSITTHTYRVRTIKDDFVGEWSDLLTVQTRMTPPSKPGDLTAVPTSTTLILNWNAVNGASSYELELDGRTITNLKDTTFKQNDLLPGSLHTYRVRAFNVGGSSPWSARSTIMTLTVPPGVPTVTEVTYTNTTATLRWSQVDDATQYEVEADGMVFNNGYAHYTEMSGLDPMTTHQYRIRAINAIGESAWSSPIDLTTHMLSTPASIQEVLEDTSITVNWNNIEGATSYEVVMDGVIVPVSSNGYFHANLVAETEHQYRIRAVNATGDSAWSELLVLTTLPSKPPIPTSIHAIAAKDAITLVWDSVPGVTGYDVELDGEVVVDNFNDTTYADIELEPYTIHKYRIRARNEAIQGEWSPLVRLYTLPEIPGVPVNIVVTSTSSIVKLDWDPDPTAFGYDIEIDGQAMNVGKKTEYLHRRIALGSEHRYRIRTRNSAGIGEWSGMIINNTLTAKLTKNKTVDLGLVTKDIVDFSKYELTVTYDPKAIDVVDLSMLTGSVELTTGRIKGTDITITAFTPGKITFVSDKAIKPDESWTGVINSIKFKARVSGGSSITYSVITKP
jgi:hypothetical protein